MTSGPRTLLTTNALVAAALLVGFVNNVAIAVIFGLTRAVDAYYAALMLPLVFMVICVDYIGKNFLPMFAKARRESDKLASELTSSVVTVVGAVSLCVALLLAVASGPVFRLLLPGFSADDIVLVQHHFWIMAPAIALMGVTAFHEYVCQHDEDFVRITLVRGMLPLSNLGAIVVASPMIGEYALPVGYLVGSLLVFLLMARRAGYRYTWRVSIRREWEGKVFVNSAIVTSTGLIGSARRLIENYLGSLLGEGAISALALATRLTDPLRRTVFSAVRMWLFGRTARLALDENKPEIARIYDIGLSGAFLLFAPVLWWVGLNSRVIVDTIFVHGNFDESMGELVSLALLGIIPAVMLAGVNNLLSNAFYAMHRVMIPASVVPLGVLIYLVFAFWLSAPYGVFGIKAAESATGLATFSILVLCLAREVPSFSVRKTFLRLLRYTAVAGVAFGLVTVSIGSSGLPSIAGAALSLVVGAALYVITLFLFKDSMLAFLFAYGRRAIGVPAPADMTTSR